MKETSGNWKGDSQQEPAVFDTSISLLIHENMLTCLINSCSGNITPENGATLGILNGIKMSLFIFKLCESGHQMFGTF